MLWSPRVRSSTTEPQVKNWMNFTAAGGGASIKSIQPGSIVLNNVTSNTATITAVNTANAFVLLVGYGGDNATTSPAFFYPRVALTNGTTVTAFVNSAEVGNHRVYFVVIEFNAGSLKSVQTGATTFSTATATATITAVNTAKAFVAYLGMTTTFSTAQNNTFMGSVELQNATTVLCSMPGLISVTMGWVVVEFF